MKRNVLITGGSGGLARFVAEELKTTMEVTLFDIVSPSESRVPWETDLKFVKGDLTDLADCMRAVTLAQADTIVHLGAIPYCTDQQPGHHPNFRMPQRLPEDTTMKVNVMGTYYIMDAARRLGVKKIIFASSFFTLGLGFRISDKPFEIDYLPIDENHRNQPQDTYSLSKVIGEEIVHTYCRAYGMKGVAFRFMGISYPFRPHPNDIELPERPNYPGFGSYQYADARDIAIACRLAIEKDLESEFESFFVITDNQYRGSPREAIEKSNPRFTHLAGNLKDDEGIISDKKIKEMLGYESKYTWRKQTQE